MVLQVFADAGQSAPQPRADRLDDSGTSEARDFQEPRRSDRAGGQQHFAPRPRLERRSFPDIGQANRPPALEQDRLGMGLVDDVQIVAAHNGLQEGGGCAPAPAPPLVDLEIVGALVVAAVEVADFRNADLDAGVAHGVENWPGQPLPFDPPFAARAVPVRASAVVVLMAQEMGLHVLPAPAFEAELAPAVIVGRLPAHVDHAVDRRTAAERLAARIGDGPAVEAGLLLGHEHPVRTRIVERVEIADRDMEPDPVVLAAGLEQEHAMAGIRGQPVRQHAARGARADDDVIVGLGLAHHVTAQQATARPRFLSTGGFSVRHRSKASGQRGWNGQPGGGAMGDGGSPASRMRSRFAVGSATGVADKSARVYGC